jgi:ribose transport system substrate-binding protein
VRVLSGQGTTGGTEAAINTAIADKPSAIVNDGADNGSLASLFGEATKQGETVVSWNGEPTPGAEPKYHVFYNVTVDNTLVARIAADYAIARSDGHANVVDFADNEFAIAEYKAKVMEAAIKACSGCKFLAYENTPIADTTTRVPPLTTALLAKYGKEWTYSVAINDNYFEAMSTALASTGIKPNDAPINISAGDGSPDAFQRIRSNFYQAGTVAAPLNLQGWQVVDELNRAFAGQGPDNFVAAPRLVTHSDILYDGGPEDAYVPNNHYKQRYMKIWGIKGPVPAGI